MLFVRRTADQISKRSFQIPVSNYCVSYAKEADSADISAKRYAAEMIESTVSCESSELLSLSFFHF